MHKYEAIPEVDEERIRVPVPARKSSLCFISSLIVLTVVGILATAVYTTLSIRPALPTTLSASPITIYQTSKHFEDRMSPLTAEMLLKRGLKLNPSQPLAFDNIDCKADPSGVCSSAAKVTLNAGKIHQLIIGFGGALTEAAAINFYKLPVDVQDKVTEMYYGETGIGYSLGRIHINSCDFGLGPYSFDDVKDDYKLEHFDYGVTHDTHIILPFIRNMMTNSARKVKIIASPWSPPWWMKEPAGETGVQNMTGSADPIGIRVDPLVDCCPPLSMLLDFTMPLILLLGAECLGRLHSEVHQLLLLAVSSHTTFLLLLLTSHISFFSSLEACLSGL